MSNDLKESRSEAGKRLLQITQAALIAAMYVALTFVFQPISYGAIQVRIAETLTIKAKAERKSSPYFSFSIT